MDLPDIKSKHETAHCSKNCAAPYIEFLPHERLDCVLVISYTCTSAFQHVAKATRFIINTFRHVHASAVCVYARIAARAPKGHETTLFQLLSEHLHTIMLGPTCHQ